MLEVRDLRTYLTPQGGWLDRLRGRELGEIKALDGVSFELRPGETLGVVGESGAGKTTLARTLLGLVPATGGSVCYRGRELVGLAERDFRPLRRKLQIVFQDPDAALNPALTIGASIGDALRFHRLAHDRGERRRRVHDVLERVGLEPAGAYAGRLPSDLSGGQKQRAVIARAIVLEPELLIADEAVSMLDASVRAAILDLLAGLRRELGLTLIHITHDLATARLLCDRIAVMRAGRVVEIAPADQLFDRPADPYTAALIGAMPSLGWDAT